MLKQYEEIIKKHIPLILQEYVQTDSIDKDCLNRIDAFGILKDYIYVLEWRYSVERGKK